MPKIGALGCVGACQPKPLNYIINACACVRVLSSLKSFRSTLPALTWLCAICARPTRNIPTHTHTDANNKAHEHL